MTIEMVSSDVSGQETACLSCSDDKYVALVHNLFFRTYEWLSS